MLAQVLHALQEADVDLRMRRVASEYVRFAGEHPHLHQVMNSPAIDADERGRAAQPAIDALEELLNTWSARHDVVLADLDEACEILWGTMHGIASLGHLSSVGNDRARRLAEQALHAILLGWRTEASANDQDQREKTQG